MRTGLFSLPVGVLALLADVVFAALPYNPSQVFVSPSDDDPLVYILTPDSSRSNQFQLFSFDTSATLTASSPQYSTLSKSLPFLTEDHPKAFTPALDGEGVLTFYTGDCTDETSAGEVWYYSPGKTGETENGTWTQSSVELSNEKAGSQVLKANYLAPGMTFPGSNGSPLSSLYIFGGMCTETTTEKGQDWISGANYSETLLVLKPDESSSDTTYKLTIPESNEHPVTQAGSTLTPLLPTYSNSSTGEQVQQQNFVLIGGHTKKAFVGTSRVALFALPETTWNYVPVKQPKKGAKSDLAKRDITEVEPRSGHTAVLTPDGSKIIVFGGWVGDTSVPAEPQLVILEVGRDYGGSGDWSWTVPEQMDSEGGLEEGAGIFGHGAAILPGGIMLIVGGYNIPSSSSKRSASEPSLNTGSLMFNISSNQWVTTYKSPEKDDPESPIPSDSESGGPLSSTGQKAGLGAGVGIGVSAAVVLVVLLFYSRRNRTHQKEREQALRDLALGAERPHFGGPQEMSSEFSGAATLFRPVGSTASVPESPYAWIGNGASEAERTGLLVEVPSPTRGLRRNLYPRGYQPASRFDDGWRNRGSTYIPPIDEQDEDEENAGEGVGELAQKVAQRDSKGSIASDPFLDPVPLDEQPGENRVNLAFPSAALRPTSKDSNISPDKSERTSSNLSESSTVSKIVSSLNTSASQKSSIRHVNSPTPSLDRPVATPEGNHENSPPQRSTGNNGKGALGGPFADSFSTAHSSFPQLQAEGEYLLGSGPEWSTPPESPEKSASPLPKNKAIGWVRRAIGSRRTTENSERSHSVSPENVTSGEQSPTKSNPFDDNQGGSRVLSRSVSTNTAALRRKQGAKDWGAEKRLSAASSLGNWEYGPGSAGAASSTAGFSSHGDDGDDEEEWDVEAAAEGRLVQVTYTVPKEKLRVVNAGAGDEENDDTERTKEQATTQRGTSTM